MQAGIVSIIPNGYRSSTVSVFVIHGMLARERSLRMAIQSPWLRVDISHFHVHLLLLGFIVLLLLVVLLFLSLLLL
jgi:hypothetical protein